MATIKSIKEKAKAYDKAIEELRGLLEGIHEDECEIMEEDIIKIFPELKESEDEKILKHLKAVVKEYDMWAERGLDMNDVLAWLEKQGKHAKFLSKIQVGDKVTINEDGVLVNLTQLKRVVNKGIEKAINEKQGEQKPDEEYNITGIHSKHAEGKLGEMVKNLKSAKFDDTNAKRMFIKALERVEEQNSKGYKLTDCDKNSWWEDFKAYTSCTIEQNPAWSEEDEKMLNSFLHKLEVCDLLSNKEGLWIKNKLKNIKDRVQPQSTWKPSDEEMEALEHYMHTLVCNEHKEILFGLYTDLKNLKK